MNRQQHRSDLRNLYARVWFLLAVITALVAVVVKLALVVHDMGGVR